MQKVFIKNLPFSMTNQEFYALASQCGELDSAHIATDRETGQSRGFGFATYVNEEDARWAVETLNGHTGGRRRWPKNGD